MFGSSAFPHDLHDAFQSISSASLAHESQEAEGTRYGWGSTSRTAAVMTAWSPMRAVEGFECTSM